MSLGPSLDQGLTTHILRSKLLWSEAHSGLRELCYFKFKLDRPNTRYIVPLPHNLRHHLGSTQFNSWVGVGHTATDASCYGGSSYNRLESVRL